jgi:hypothetical protein
MRLVENWRAAWKWLSMQFIGLALIWESLPPDAVAVIPEPWGGWITLVLLIGAGLGRMIDQGAAK